MENAKRLNSKSKKNHTHYPLRHAMILTMSIQLIIAIIILAGIAYHNGLKNTIFLTKKNISQFSVQISQNINKLLDQAVSINLHNSRLISSGIIESKEYNKMLDLFWHQKDVFPYIRYFLYSNNLGEFIGLQVTDNGEVRQQISGFDNLLISYKMNKDGRAESIDNLSTDFYPTKRPWYKRVIEEGKPAWTDIYTWINPATLAITHCSPVNPNNTASIVCTDLTLSHLSDYLSTHNPFENGVTYITNHSGYIVATSTNSNPFKLEKSGPQLLHASQHINAQISQPFSHNNGKIYKTIEIDDTTYIHSYINLNNTHGMKWTLHTVVPEDEILASVFYNNKMTLMIGAVITVIFFISILYLSKYISAPIERISRFLKDKEFKKSSILELPAKYKEIFDLQIQFSNMYNALSASISSLKSEIKVRKALETERDQLSKKLLLTHDEERLRLSRELHDGIGPMLMTIKLGTQILFDESKFTEGAKQKQFSSILNNINNTITDLRAIAKGLRPSCIEKGEIEQLIQDYCHDFQNSTGIQIEHDLTSGITLPLSIKDNLLRIVQEAMNNSHKHGKANQIKIRLFKQASNLILQIIDNGCGMVVSSKSGIGMFTMKERASIMKGEALYLNRQPTGFTVQVTIPIAVNSCLTSAVKVSSNSKLKV